MTSVASALPEVLEAQMALAASYTLQSFHPGLHDGPGGVS